METANTENMFKEFCFKKKWIYKTLDSKRKVLKKFISLREKH